MCSERNTHLNSKQRTEQRTALSGTAVLMGLSIVLLLHSQGVFAQGSQGIRVVPTIPGPISVKPGEVATAGIRISSTFDQNVRCLSMIDLPAGWRRLIGEQGFDVRPGTEEVRLLSIAVPKDAPSGSYIMSYVLRSADSGEELTRVDFRVKVLSSLGLDLIVLHAPTSAVAGVPYIVTYQLTNTSNESGGFRLRVRSIPELPATIDSAGMVLYPGEVREIDVRVTTDESNTVRFRHALELQASLDLDSTVVERATALVSILPRTTFAGEEVSVPLQFTFRHTGENRNSGSQVELFGTGSFSGGQTDHYELLLRGPDNRTQSLLGRRDEYRVSYEHSGTELIVGDQAFRLTPLTELGRYAFGASGRVQLERWHAGAFVNEARWSPAKARQTGAFTSFDITPDASIGLNYLHKAETRTTDILTVQSEVAVLERADLSVEIGGSQSPGEKGKGIGLELRSRPDWIQYGFNLIYAEPNYGGYYRDFDAKAINLAVFPVDQLRFEGYYRNEKRGLDKDPALLYAPQNEELQAGVGYGSSIAAYYKRVSERDLLPNPKYDRRENTFVLHIGANYQSGSVFATIDVGRTEELLLGRSYPLRRISLSSRFQPDAFQGYNVSLEYGSTKDLFTDQNREGTSWSLSAWYHLSSSLQLQAGVYQSWTIAPFRQMNTLGDATIEYTLPYGHRVSIMGRINSISSSFEADNVAYSFEYMIPFAVSFSSTPEGGTLEGKVLDLESGLGLRDVVIYAGEQVAVTDGSGRFEFPNLREGTYDISVDRGIIGPDRIPSEILPSNLQMVDGLKRYLEIGVTQSGIISGEVVGYHEYPAVSPDSSTRRSEKLKGVTVELRSETELFRRVTDSRGRFNFMDLRPGKWRIKAEGDGLPGELRAENVEREIDLRPGQTVETGLELVPAQRRIRLLQEGTLLKVK